MLNKNKLSIKKIVIPNSNIAILKENSILKEALELMNKYKYGVAFCINNKGKLMGVITDGDIRRKILKVQKPFSALLTDDIKIHMNKKPKKIFINSNLTTALNKTRKYKIWDLPVISRDNRLQGMLHLHPIVNLFLKR